MHFSEWINHSNTANYMFLMQPGNYSVSSLNEHYLVRITLTGCGLSLVCCIISLFIICYLPHQKGDGPYVVGNMCTSLLIAQLSFIGAENAYPTITWCKGATAIIHYLYLTIHFWSLCFAIHLIMKLTGVLQTKRSKRRSMLTIIGWLSPALIVGITAVIRGDMYGNDVVCWLTAKNGTRYAFLGPVYIIMVINFSVTGIVMVARSIHDRLKQVPLLKRIGNLVMTFVTLVPILSLTWVFGIASADNMFSQYLFVLLNSSQGLWILVCHMMPSSPVKALLQTKPKRLAEKNSDVKNIGDSDTSEEVSGESTKSSELDSQNLEKERKKL